MTAAATAEVERLARAYYGALEEGTDLACFYATDAAAGPLGPVVKIGSDAGEEYVGWAATERALAGVRRAFARNRLESRGRLVRVAGDVAWFYDCVWWSGEVDGRPFGSLTRWTGVCLRTTGGWRFVQVHVSEGVSP